MEGKPSITLQSNDSSTNLTFGKIRTTARGPQHFLLTTTISIVPLMIVTYTLQSYRKGIMSDATQFDFNTDLGLTTIIGHKKDGAAMCSL
jgi:hypothetical protein